MILRIFKSDYSPTQLASIVGKFEIAKEEDKVLSIAGDFNELNSIMSGEAMPEETYKDAFVDYKDGDGKLQYTNELIATTRKTILNNLLLIASKGVWTEEARELYNYLNK